MLRGPLLGCAVTDECTAAVSCTSSSTCAVCEVCVCTTPHNGRYAQNAASSRARARLCSRAPLSARPRCRSPRKRPRRGRLPTTREPSAENRGNARARCVCVPVSRADASGASCEPCSVSICRGRYPVHSCSSHQGGQRSHCGQPGDFASWLNAALLLYTQESSRGVTRTAGHGPLVLAAALLADVRPRHHRRDAVSV